MAEKQSQDVQGTPGEGRFYRPPSVAPEEDATTAVGTPEGRFYLPSSEDKAGESVAENPVDQAGVLAGDPPTKAEVKVAKAEQKAADQASSSTSSAPTVPSVQTTADPAASTGQPDPVAAAAELAQEGPSKAEVKTAKAEQQAAGQPADPKPLTAKTAKKTAAKKSSSSR